MLNIKLIKVIYSFLLLKELFTMITAKKNSLIENLFAVYNKNLIRRYFNALHISGLVNCYESTPALPLIIYLNHSSWWDGLVAFELSRKMKLDSFIMMEEKNLKRLSFFRTIGAFSVDRENRRSSLKTLNYVIDLLEDTPNRALWIFPQGEILHNDVRPLVFYNGISRIIEKLGKTRILPVALRFEFLDDYKPDIFIKIGAVQTISSEQNFNPKKTTKFLADILAANLDELKKEIIEKNFNDFERII